MVVRDEAGGATVAEIEGVTAALVRNSAHRSNVHQDRNYYLLAGRSAGQRIAEVARSSPRPIVPKRVSRLAATTESGSQTQLRESN